MRGESGVWRTSTAEERAASRVAPNGGACARAREVLLREARQRDADGARWKGQEGGRRGPSGVVPRSENSISLRFYARTPLGVLTQSQGKQSALRVQRAPPPLPPPPPAGATASPAFASGAAFRLPARRPLHCAAGTTAPHSAFPLDLRNSAQNKGSLATSGIIRNPAQPATRRALQISSRARLASRLCLISVASRRFALWPQPQPLPQTLHAMWCSIAHSSRPQQPPPRSARRGPRSRRRTRNTFDKCTRKMQMK